MQEAWWLYGLIALGCVLLFLLVKVVEHKVMKEGDSLDMLSFAVGFLGFLFALKALDTLKFFG